MITFQLNLSRIDHARTYKKVVNGEECEFVELVFVETPKNKWADYIITQKVPKAEFTGKQPIIGVVPRGKLSWAKVKAREREMQTPD